MFLWTALILSMMASPALFADNAPIVLRDSAGSESPVVLTLPEVGAATAPVPAKADESPVGAEATASAVATATTPAKVDALKESEIPVFAAKDSKKIEKGPTLGGRIAITVAILLSVLGGGALFIKRWMHRVREKNPATQIKILTQHYLGPKKSLAIIRVAGESILIGVTDHNISLIKSLALLDDDIPEETPVAFQVAEQSPASVRHVEADEEDTAEEFHMAGINKLVQGRLKGMRKWM